MITARAYPSPYIAMSCYPSSSSNGYSCSYGSFVHHDITRTASNYVSMAPQVERQMFCKNCGGDIKEGATSCQYCKASLFPSMPLRY